MWNSLIKVPSPILHAATGIDESVFDSYKKLPLVIAPGTGGTACMAKCGLNFTTVRTHPALGTLLAGHDSLDMNGFPGLLSHG